MFVLHLFCLVISVSTVVAVSGFTLRAPHADHPLHVDWCVAAEVFLSTDPSPLAVAFLVVPFIVAQLTEWFEMFPVSIESEFLDW